MSGPHLSVSGLRAGYGRVQVVFDVSFDVSGGETVAVVGRNGAGKTTSFMAVAGLRQGVAGGTVMLDDQDISKASPLGVVQAGLCLVAEGRRVFRDMTVTENLRMGAYTRRRRDRDQIPEDLDRVRDLFPALGEFRNKLVGELSGGQQQMVAVGQALMSRPKFVLLDEPTSGLAPALIEEMYDAFGKLVGQGIGVVVVDQSVERVIEWSDRYYVIESGRVIKSGRSTADAVPGINDIVLGVSRL